MLLPRNAGFPGVLLLFDFDGTLSEIVDDPGTALLRPGNARMLDILSRNPGYTVGVISGRALDDVSDRVGLPNLIYGGNHGMEIKGLDFRYLHPDVSAAVRGLSEIATDLKAALAGIPGALVEDKSLTLTVHFRQTPAHHHVNVQSIVGAAIEEPVANGKYRVSSAKAAIEIKPAVDWHKGRALDLIRSRMCPEALPIFVGDDRTDEDAFKAAQDAGGFGIFVGPAENPTLALYRLESPAAVSAALADLILR